MRYLALLCAGFGLALASCGNNTETTSKATDSVATAPVANAGPTSALSDTATADLMNLVSSYYNLKDALVATDAAKADAAAGRLMSDAEGFKLTAARQNNGAALQPQVDIIQQESDALVNTNVDSIGPKRAHFSKISDAMYALLRAAALKNGGIYQQFCPMALNDKGANWLSPESEIRNPYFGTKMMECGEVRDSL